MSAIAVKSGTSNVRRTTLRVLHGSGRQSLRAVPGRWTPVVIRLAVAADEEPLRQLAQLDSARPLHGQKLVAEQSGAIVAAVSLTDEGAIADPFTPTADAIALLRLRARQLQSGEATAA